MTDETAPHVDPPVELDELDHRLIEALLADARLGNRALAAKLGTSEATVGARLRRLVANGVLVFTAVVDWEAAGYEWFVIARIAVRDRPPADVAADVADIRGSIAVSLVVGSADVLASFLLEGRTELQRLLQHELWQVTGISHVGVNLATESFVTELGSQWFLSRRADAVQLPRSVLAVDDVDLGVLNALLADARQSSRRIGRTLGVSEGTVRARLSRLVHASLIRPLAMVDPFLAGRTHTIAYIDVHVQPDHDLRAVLKAILDIPTVIFAAIVVGTADLSVSVAAEDRYALRDRIYAVRSVAGVRSADPLEILDFVKLVPYYKRLIPPDW